VLVTDAYHRRCAVTGERTLPALDASHIRPYSEGGEHSVANGLLLRRDIHCLFDKGYGTVTSDHAFEVSTRIREEFENGRDYYALQGKQLTLPNRSALRPEPAALNWHSTHRFLG
jgi:putative restriction endonuclease